MQIPARPETERFRHGAVGICINVLTFLAIAKKKCRAGVQGFFFGTQNMDLSSGRCMFSVKKDAMGVAILRYAIAYSFVNKAFDFFFCGVGGCLGVIQVERREGGVEKPSKPRKSKHNRGNLLKGQIPFEK